MIQCLQFTHHNLSNPPRSYFPGILCDQLLFNVAHRIFNLFNRYGALFQRPHHSTAYPLLIKGIPATIIFNDHRHVQQGSFIGCKAGFTRDTLTTSAHLTRFIRQAGVDYFGIWHSTKGAFHNRISTIIIKGKRSTGNF